MFFSAEISLFLSYSFPAHLQGAMTYPLKLCFARPNMEQGYSLGWSEVLHLRCIPGLGYDSLLGRDHNQRQVSRAWVNGINSFFSLVEICCPIYHWIVFVVLKFFTETQIREIYCIFIL